MVLDRVKQILSHLTPPNSPSTSPYPGLSYHVGPHSPPLKHVTLAQLLQEQVLLNGDGEAVVSAWQNIRWTYRDLHEKSNTLAKCFYALGIRKRDRMAIMAGNCAEYVAVAWTMPWNHLIFRRSLLLLRLEQYWQWSILLTRKRNLNLLWRKLVSSDFRMGLTLETKLFITTPKLNQRSHIPLIKHLVPSLSLESPSPVLPSLEHIIIINNSATIPSELSNFLTFDHLPTADVDLTHLQSTLSEHDVVNLQFTSGTTGSSKAAMLTH